MLLLWGPFIKCFLLIRGAFTAGRPPMLSKDTALAIVPSAGDRQFEGPDATCGAVRGIDAIRGAHDKAHPRWPAHINLVWPFVAVDTVWAHWDELAAICGECPPLKLTLAEFGVTETAHKVAASGNSRLFVHLRPEPAKPLAQLAARMREWARSVERGTDGEAGGGGGEAGGRGNTPGKKKGKTKGKGARGKVSGSESKEERVCAGESEGDREHVPHLTVGQWPAKECKTALRQLQSDWRPLTFHVDRLQVGKRGEKEEKGPCSLCRGCVGARVAACAAVVCYSGVLSRVLSRVLLRVLSRVM